MNVLKTPVHLLGAMGLVVGLLASPSRANQEAGPEIITVAPQPVAEVVKGDPCCPPPCIKYRHHQRWKRVCCGCDCCCKPPIKVLLTVPDPCCCDRAVEIPLCIPACCKGAPKLCGSRCGPLCRGVVNYEWCCGYRVKVVFRRNGDIVVHTYGR